MYVSILVPLDGSKRAERILPHVDGLAKCLGSTLIFLQVVPPAYYMMDPQVSFVDVNIEETRWRVEEAQKYLEKLKTEYDLKGINIETLVEQGPVVETIIKVARREDVGMISLASHGRSGLGRVFYGSVAAGVLNQVRRPILMVRSRDDD